MAPVNRRKFIGALSSIAAMLGATSGSGRARAAAVTEDYAEGDNEFTGKIEKVTVELM